MLLENTVIKDMIWSIFVQTTQVWRNYFVGWVDHCAPTPSLTHVKYNSTIALMTLSSSDCNQTSHYTFSRLPDDVYA